MMYFVFKVFWYMGGQKDKLDTKINNLQTLAYLGGVNN